MFPSFLKYRKCITNICAHLHFWLPLTGRIPRRCVQQCFRANIIKRSRLRKLDHTRRVHRNVTGYAKINQLQSSVYHQKIGRLQIGMNNSIRMYVLYTQQHLVPISHQFVQWNVRRVLLQHPLQIRVTTFHNHVQPSFHRRMVTDIYEL